MKKVSSLLIVDDNPVDVQLSKIVFGRTGRFRCVRSVSDGADALALFTDFDASRAADPEAFPPDLVLLDINMPRMGAFAFLEAYAQIRDAVVGHGVDPQVIVFSSADDPSERQRCEASPLVAGYLVKPASVEDGIALAERFGTEPSL